MRNTREASQIATIIEAIMIIILRANCHAGIVSLVKRMMTASGALKGKKLNIVNMIWFGFIMNRLVNHKGNIAGRTTIVVHWLLSFAVEPIEPIAANITPNNI